jgi:hypothetical protein
MGVILPFFHPMSTAVNTTYSSSYDSRTGRYNVGAAAAGGVGGMMEDPLTPRTSAAPAPGKNAGLFL